MTDYLFLVLIAIIWCVAIILGLFFYNPEARARANNRRISVRVALAIKEIDARLEQRRQSQPASQLWRGALDNLENIDYGEAYDFHHSCGDR